MNESVPEQTQLYRIIADHWQTFLQERSFEGRDVPKFIVSSFIFRSKFSFQPFKLIPNS
jgi:hypothetical protein